MSNSEVLHQHTDFLTTTKKFCVNCKWCDKGIQPIIKCKHPLSEIGHNLVTGHISYRSCTENRGLYGICHNAELFEEKAKVKAIRWCKGLDFWNW